MVIWILGISGAGKTTIGTRLREYLCEKKIANYLLDGDEVRAVFDGDLGFSRQDREANIKRIILAAYALDKCGIVAIVCNISPFEGLRSLARRKIAGYREVYLKKDLQISREKDVKGVYSTNRTMLVGVDIVFEEPARPNLVLAVDTESVDESAKKVIDFVESEMACGTAMGH